jgi:hypothetical protein
MSITIDGSLVVVIKARGAVKVMKRAPLDDSGFLLFVYSYLLHVYILFFQAQRFYPLVSPPHMSS